MEGEQTTSRNRQTFALIASGLVLFILQLFPAMRDAVLFLILGGILLIPYFLKKNQACLIAGCMMAGIGLTKLIDSVSANYQDFEAIGVGVGFVAIFTIMALFENKIHWWPIFTGLVLILTGLGSQYPRFIKGLTQSGTILMMIVGMTLLVVGTKQTPAKLSPNGGKRNKSGLFYE